MKSSLEPTKVNTPIIINENQSLTWHTMVKGDRALTSANMYRGTLTHLVISYQSASTPLQISLAGRQLQVFENLGNPTNKIQREIGTFLVNFDKEI